jgi:cytochrome c biogenesis protein
MSVNEDTISEIVKNPTVKAKPKAPILNRFLDFISSVRFGVFLLCLLTFLSFLGMIIVQQNVQGFETFYASLTPAEKLVFSSLGFFDIYHSWYYNLCLLILSLNIILASIDRFPTARSYISRPKTTATKPFLLRQMAQATIFENNQDEGKILENVRQILKKFGYQTKDVEKNGQKFVFAESGKWNRMGAYIVHVFLLTLFLGHFVALQTGFDADVRLTPTQETSQIELIRFNLDKQERFNVQLPFTLTCTDIEQQLIDPKGSIEINNTIDWRTQIKIDDPQFGTTVADVQLNKPYSYRGYRFFQASAITEGKARKMTLELTPENGGETQKVELLRNGEATLSNGLKIKYDTFWSDFVVGQESSFDNSYKNPAVRLRVTTPDGKTDIGYAFAMKVPDNAPIGRPFGGYKFRLAEFEKVPVAHVLSIKYDPFDAAWIAWYIGGTGLMFALVFVFFFSHQRIWVLLEKREDGQKGYELTLGGDANRNTLAFKDKFKKIINSLENKD